MAAKIKPKRNQNDSVIRAKTNQNAVKMAAFSRHNAIVLQHKQKATTIDKLVFLFYKRYREK